MAIRRLRGKVPDLCVRDHAGYEFDVSQREFFAAPPAEIGTVLSQWSTLSVGDTAMSSYTRAALTFGAGVLVACVGVAFGSVWDDGLVVVLSLIAGAALSCFLWISTRRLHTVSYVGRSGTARYWSKGNGHKTVRSDLFLFADAWELNVRITRNYVRATSVHLPFHDPGLYSGTTYVFEWINLEGSAVFSIHGKYFSERGEPASSDLFWYARSVETAWSNFLDENVDALKDERGAIHFRIGDGDSIEIAADRLIINLNGKQSELVATQIGRIELNRDDVVIWEKGTRIGILSTPGLTQFPFAHLANSQFFLLTVVKVFGVQAETVAS